MKKNKQPNNKTMKTNRKTGPRERVPREGSQGKVAPKETGPNGNGSQGKMVPRERGPKENLRPYSTSCLFSF